MSILEKLKADHDKVREILKQADELVAKFPQVNEEQEIRLMKKLISELEPHSKAEEKIFYNALRQKDKDNLNPYEGKEEHALALQVLKALQKGNLEKSKRTAKIQVLKEMLLHHIKEEEAKYFSQARKCFDVKELDKMGEDFTKEKKKIIKLKKY